MTQPARRTFLPGHVVVIICSITIQLSNIAIGPFIWSNMHGPTTKSQALLLWAYCFSAILSLAT